MKTIEEIQGDFCHQSLIEDTKQILGYDSNNNYDVWKNEIREKFCELFGLKNIEEYFKNYPCSLNLDIEKEEKKDGYRQIRFTIESERNAIVPCYLLIPNGNKKKYPVAITLQGHSSGFHNSIAEPKNPNENDYALGRGCFAVQAVKNGYVALAIEQRGMGERRPIDKNRNYAHMCSYSANVAFMLGRTILGERIWDVKRVIDSLDYFDFIDKNDIFITGNSGGGTISFYSACYDERIKMSVPSCAFCSYKESILDLYHCACNYVPNAYNWFDMQDLSCLIASRKLLVIAGATDNNFPIDGVKRAFETVKKIYEKCNASENCKMIVTPKGHWWCEDIVWKAISDFRNNN